MNSDLTRRAAMLALIFVTAAAGSPSLTHAHSAADRHTAEGDDGQAAEGRQHDHAHHGGERHRHGARHRHVALLGILDVEIPATPDQPTTERGDDPFVLLDEAPLPNADDDSAKTLSYAAAVLCPQGAGPTAEDRRGRTRRPPAVAGEPRSAVLRV